MSSSDVLSSDSPRCACEAALADQLDTVLLLQRWTLALVGILAFVCLATWVLWCAGARLKVRKIKHRIGDAVQSSLRHEQVEPIKRTAASRYSSTGGSGSYSD